jgi:hypothetical protein
LGDFLLRGVISCVNHRLEAGLHTCDSTLWTTIPNLVSSQRTTY